VRLGDPYGQPEVLMFACAAANAIHAAREGEEPDILGEPQARTSIRPCLRFLCPSGVLEASCKLHLHTAACSVPASFSLSFLAMVPFRAHRRT
jgi:hypothetical protein